MRKFLALAALLPALTFAAEPFALRGIELEKTFDRSVVHDCYWQGDTCEGRMDLLTFGGMVRVRTDKADAVKDVTLTFRTQFYDELKRALVGKYGKPATSQTLTLQNSFGAQVPSTIMTWQQGDVEMMVIEHADLDHGLVHIYHPETRVSAGL